MHLTPAEVRKNVPFLEEASDQEISLCTATLKNLPLLKSLAKKMKEGLWNEVMTICHSCVDGFRLLLGAHIIDKEVSSTDVATGFIFLDAVIRKIGVSVVPASEMKEFSFHSSIPANQHFIMKTQEHHHPITSFGFIIHEAKKESPSFEFVPKFGASTRRTLIKNLRQFKADVAFPAPGKTLYIHAVDNVMSWTIQHDRTHTFSREHLLKTIGVTRFLLLLDIADLFEDLQEQMEPYSVRLTTLSREPLIEVGATKNDLIRFLIYTANSIIIDGGAFSEITSFSFDAINEDSLRFILNVAIMYLKDLITNDFSFLFEGIQLHPKYDNELIDDAIQYLKDKSFLTKEQSHFHLETSL